MTTAIQDRLPRLTKFLYGISDFGFACTDTTMQVLFAIFMTDVVGVKPAYAALAIFIGRTWDYINDPLIGFYHRPGAQPLGTPASLPALRFHPIRADVRHDVVPPADGQPVPVVRLLRTRLFPVRYFLYLRHHAVRGPDTRTDPGLR